jgi:hypothetical protein
MVEVEVLEPLKVVMGKVVAAVVVEDMVVEIGYGGGGGSGYGSGCGQGSGDNTRGYGKMVVVAEAEDKVVKMDMAVVLDVDLVGEEAMDKMNEEVRVATKVLVQPSLNTQRSRYNSRLGGVS